MARYLVKGGSHVHAGAVYSAGEVFEGPPGFLALFPGKFEKTEQEVTKKPHRMPPLRGPKAAPVVEEETVEETKPDEVNTLGEDITAKFNDAADLDLRVFKGNKKYSVTEGSTPGEALNKEPLTSVAAVEEFIGKYRR